MKASKNFQPGPAKFKPTKLRITSGHFRNRKITYNGDPATRPMKERTRESVFSLVGGKLPGFLALDLFGGTGVLGLESISRGAEEAVILELAHVAVKSILKSVEELEIGEQVRVHNVDSLRWMRDADKHVASWSSELSWVVFCCPPYRMWERELEKLVAGLTHVWELAPAGSYLVCETESSFDLPSAMPSIDWDVRRYNPAHIAVAKKAVAAAE